MIFIDLCDHKGTTLVLIESTENFIIGGYTTHNWDKSGNCIMKIIVSFFHWEKIC